MQEFISGPFPKHLVEMVAMFQPCCFKLVFGDYPSQLLLTLAHLKLTAHATVLYMCVPYTGVQNLISLFTAIVSDLSILFVSSNYTDLVQAQQAIATLVYPLELG